MCRSKFMLAAVGALAMAVSVGSGQEVVRKVTSEKLEGILKEMNITYKKTAGKNDGVFFYDYERNSINIRLHNYNGKDLWIDAVFSDKMTLEEINRWNIRAKFSRAVLIKDANNKETVSLESQIDCQGGITDDIIKLFVNRFDNELAEFRRFITR